MKNFTLFESGCNCSASISRVYSRHTWEKLIVSEVYPRYHSVNSSELGVLERRAAEESRSLLDGASGEDAIPTRLRGTQNKSFLAAITRDDESMYGGRNFVVSTSAIASLGSRLGCRCAYSFAAAPLCSTNRLPADPIKLFIGGVKRYKKKPSVKIFIKNYAPFYYLGNCPEPL